MTDIRSGIVPADMEHTGGPMESVEKVRIKLAGLDGNAFNLLGAFRAAAREQGWPASEIKRVCDEAASADYSHLLATLAEHAIAPVENEDDGS